MAEKKTTSQRTSRQYTEAWPKPPQGFIPPNQTQHSQKSDRPKSSRFNPGKSRRPV